MVDRVPDAALRLHHCGRVGIAKKLRQRHGGDAKVPQALRDVAVLAFGRGVQRAPAVLRAEGEVLHGVAGERLDRPSHLVAGVLHVRGTTDSTTQRASAPEQLAHPPGQENSIWVELQGPVAIAIKTILEDPVPDLDEDVRIERCEIRAAPRHGHAALDDGDLRAGPRPPGRPEACAEELLGGHVAEDHVLVTAEDAHTCQELLSHEHGLVAARLRGSKAK
mmetsp:Transcript_30972/g.88801  ORF Transcript_30972/g.88801 Transcript_30972/m.88801 type:complete len:221 (+) Transcript_30972:204-866(+)